MKFIRKLFHFVGSTPANKDTTVALVVLYILIVLTPASLFYRYIAMPYLGQENLIGAIIPTLWIYFATKSIFKSDK